MNKMKNKTPIMRDERIRLRAWSDKHQSMKTLASYTLYSNGIVYIQPSGEMESYFKGLGLPIKKTFFELDINNCPTGTVAKAFGINYNDVSVRRKMMEMNNSELNGPAVLGLAFKGMTNQMGVLESLDYPAKAMRAIDLDGVQHHSDVLLKKDLIIISESREHDIVRKDILVKEGKTLRHAYILTTNGSVEQSTERLAVQSAALASIGSLRSINSDKVLGLRFDHDMRPSLICYNNHRPPIEIEEVRRAQSDSTHLFAIVKTEAFTARRPFQAIAPVLKTKDASVFSDYVTAGILKNICRDAIYATDSAPMINEEQLALGNLTTSAEMDVEGLLKSAKSNLPYIASKVEREVKLHHPGCLSPSHLSNMVEERLVAMVRLSDKLSKDYSAQRDQHIIRVQEREDVMSKKPQKVYDLTEMSM